MSLGIVNGTVVTATDRYAADLRIENGRIAAIGHGVADSSEEKVDARGLLLLPGGVDAHTHFALPFGGTVSSDDFESGTRAAAFGGTTTASTSRCSTRASRCARASTIGMRALKAGPPATMPST